MTLKRPNLQKIRKSKGYTQESLGEVFGVDKSQISKLESGKTKLHAEWIKKFCELLEVSPTELIGDALINNNVVPAGHISVPIKGYVQAGQFGEANELSVGDEDVLYVSPKYPSAYALIVKGDSMNLRFKENARLICVPILDYEKEIKPGKAVIVEAVCVADEIETTVKELYTDENNTNWLLPRSTNPVYQNYPVPNGEEIDITINGRKIKEINIKAVVVSSQYDEE